MVAIDGDQVGRDAGDGDGTVAATARSREPHSYPEVPDSLQRTARHLLNQLRVVLAITVGGRERRPGRGPGTSCGPPTATPSPSDPFRYPPPKRRAEHPSAPHPTAHAVSPSLP